MTEQESTRLPNEGEAAYFVHLHLTTVRPKGPHPHRHGEWVYEANGKPRPMLVIRALPKRDRGARWFLALPITSKARPERDNMLESIGTCLSESTE